MVKDYTVEIERTYRTVLTVKALNRKQAMRDAQGISEGAGIATMENLLKFSCVSLMPLAQMGGLIVFGRSDTGYHGRYRRQRHGLRRHQRCPVDTVL